jgi:hypothetical protein
MVEELNRRIADDSKAISLSSFAAKTLKRSGVKAVKR